MTALSYLQEIAWKMIQAFQPEEPSRPAPMSPEMKTKIQTPEAFDMRLRRTDRGHVAPSP